MTERLADVTRRIGTTRQLGAVVNAMRGIASARALQSRALLPAVRAYAEIASGAIGQARLLDENGGSQVPRVRSGQTPVLLVFGAEQGFAGAFAEQVLDATQTQFVGAHVFLVGSRAITLAAGRGLTAAWHGELPSRASAIPQMVVMIVDALYAYLGSARTTAVALVYPVWTPGTGIVVTRRALLPFNQQALPARAKNAGPPLTNLSTADLVARLVEEHVFAQVCEAAMEAFAAENEARMMTMAAAKTNIDGKLADLQAQERRIRQEEVTAEVIELAASDRGHARR